MDEVFDVGVRGEKGGEGWMGKDSKGSRKGKLY